MLWSPALALFCLFSGTEVRLLASVLHKKMSPRKIILWGVIWFRKISYQKEPFFFSKSQYLDTLLKRYLHRFVSCPVQFHRKKKSALRVWCRKYYQGNCSKCHVHWNTICVFVYPWKYSKFPKSNIFYWLKFISVLLIYWQQEFIWSVRCCTQYKHAWHLSLRILVSNIRKEVRIHGKVSHDRIFTKSVEFDFVLADGEETGGFFKILNKR